MKFCWQCGTALESRIPAGDDHPRGYCRCCEATYYPMRKTVVGCIVHCVGQVLVCRRDKAARWQLPMGYMRKGESATQAALRELSGCVKIHGQTPKIFRLFESLGADRLSMIYRVPVDEDIAAIPGPDSSARWIAISELDEADLETVTHQALDEFRDDFATGSWTIRLVGGVERIRAAR